MVKAGNERGFFHGEDRRTVRVGCLAQIVQLSLYNDRSAARIAI